MIKVNDYLVNVDHFPDGTQCVRFPVSPDDVLRNSDIRHPNNILWCYDSDEEMFTMACVVDWIRRRVGIHVILNLSMPYLPNARMDRIKNANENFSLRVFANFINSLKFDSVQVFNVHSNVSEALINNICNVSPNSDVDLVIRRYNPDIIFFPDEGACKRYTDLQAVKWSDCPVTFGIKKRDWHSGEILGLDVISDTDLTGKKVLIVDDICSAGGTFKFSAMKLKEMGAADVALYVSHCEDNIQNGVLLKSDLISKIYTTDSILHIEDPKIQIVHNFRK